MPALKIIEWCLWALTAVNTHLKQIQRAAIIPHSAATRFRARCVCVPITKTLLFLCGQLNSTDQKSFLGQFHYFSLYALCYDFLLRVSPNLETNKLSTRCSYRGFSKPIHHKRQFSHYPPINYNRLEDLGSVLVSSRVRFFFLKNYFFSYSFFHGFLVD